MAKQTLELEIPEGWVLTGEYRFSRDGEHFLTPLRKVVKHRLSDAIPRIIVRQDWQWPEWLKAPWIAMDKCGDWYVFNVVPKRDTATWQTIDDLGGSKLSSSFYDIDLPSCEDWTKSLRKNPHLGD